MLPAAPVQVVLSTMELAHFARSVKRSAAHAHSINRTVVSATPTVRAHQLAAAQVTHMKAHFLVWHATTNAALAPPSPPPA